MLFLDLFSNHTGATITVKEQLRVHVTLPIDQKTANAVSSLRDVHQKQVLDLGETLSHKLDFAQPKNCFSLKEIARLPIAQRHT